MKRARSIFVMTALSIIFYAGPAMSEDFGTETQNLITQTIEAAMNSAIQGGGDQTVSSEMQSRMMSRVSNVVKQNTAARKRATVIETCMECRAMQPIKVVISNQTTFLDAETQKLVNQAMAKKIEETIRVISSDPVVARSVQEKMMSKRMATSPLREKMQPFIMGRLLSDSTEINFTEGNGINAESQLDKVTMLRR
ncbi:MAG: hypothetical protein D3910_05460 [Candidatus Electrothrix sp. ATG2]|nr:hypothetical protein [Candidatus Electrothrix sp. ATG2]